VAERPEEYSVRITNQDPAPQPAEVFPPWVYLADEIEARGWKLFDDFQQRSGLFEGQILDISRRKPVTPEVAARIGMAFGQTAETWLAIDAAWQAAQAKSDEGKTE
jgi:plasmid maintenance system antidote protein VapI